MGLRRDPVNKDYVLTSPSGEELATWPDQPMTESLAHAMINEAYRCGHRFANTKLARIEQIVREK